MQRMLEWKRKLQPNLLHINFITFQYTFNEDAINMFNAIPSIKNLSLTKLK